ncbi:MAG: hypothetical protein AAFR00_13915 [Pseudomonadota bacterium]
MTSKSKKQMVKLGRQWWSFAVEKVETDYPIVRLKMAAPDLRPFRCDDDGRPEDRQIGRQSLTLPFSKQTGRVIRSNDVVGTFDADQFRELSCAIRGFLGGEAE